MASDAFLRFLESMRGNYLQWHDGTGYDLQALAKLETEERGRAEAALISRLANPGDWRDVEALCALGTPTALAAVDGAAQHRNPEVRKYIREMQAGPPPPKTEAEEEDEVIAAMKLGGLDSALWHPTPRVKRALLDQARLDFPGRRVKAAELLLKICDVAPDPPFVERFATEDNQELRAAWTELRRRTGI